MVQCRDALGTGRYVGAESAPRSRSGLEPAHPNGPFWIQRRSEPEMLTVRGDPMASVKRPRILIADDHRFVAEACANILAPEFDVLGIFADGQQLLTALATSKPDVIVMDVAMPMMNGLEAGRRTKQLSRAIRIVYLTMNPDLGVAAEAFRAGASGYLLKTSSATELVVAVREVLKGNRYVSPLLTKDPDSFFQNVRTSHMGQEMLTDRQRSVLQLLAEGRSMKEIAYILDVTPRTVAFHKYTIMEKMRFRTNSDLVQYAMREHFISPHP